jgi:hypothetical protein
MRHRIKEHRMACEIEVYGLDGRRLGVARSFGEAKRMQQASLPDDLKPLYAGIGDGDPLFYADMMTNELYQKYPRLASSDWVP